MSGTTVPRIRTVEVFRHDRPHETDEAVRLLTDAAREAGVELVFDADGPVRADICLVLGGDGATLRALRKHAGTGVPVFAINFGRIGFLATVDREDLPRSIEIALSGQFEVVSLPALVADGRSSSERFAINEISFQRRPEINIAHLSYSLAGDWVARVPCDGLIAATPAGSTAYSLSVGGPIVAWGVKGFVVNVIAPHALSSRALVAAPEDVLRVVNDGADPVDVVIDGIRTGELAAGQDCEIKFTPDVVGLAQLPDSSFYRRFREKLLQLTS
ncbi:MAG TPA: NAD(+)/NADH kinase [Solirubrobacterales bacterium]|nr:NAD(+)/NADH kinase [Solirubrobacterales bacterium]